MRARGWIAAFALAVGASAHAEVPMHNPDLDHQCTPGYQWSRDTVACEQANCPPGSGRTYTLECNCGEAWGRPFVTCRDPKTGLATHCVAVPMTCEGVKAGFDPLTGQCRTGFTADATGECKATFPERLRCRLEMLNGVLLGGLQVHFSERAPPGGNLQWIAQQEAKTGSDGTVEFPVANRNAEAVMFSLRDANGKSIHNVRIAIDQQPGECVMKVYDAGEAMTHVKNEYADLLAQACLSADEIALLRAIERDPASTGKPRFDPETNKVLGNIEGPWDETGRTLFHELGHAISDQILDPTWGFVKGIPLVGKHAGGDHDPWVPNQVTDDWGPDVDAEELAFEEGLADFLAMLHFARRGEPYDPDLMTTERAQQALNASGPASGSRIEGVVTSFLWQYYKPLIESGPDGPARALGDFIRVTRYNARNAKLYGKPARTIQDFIAAAATAAGEQHPCNHAGQTAPLAELAGRYGLTGAPPPTVRLGPTKPDPNDEFRQILERLGHDAATLTADPGKWFTVPAGQARTSLTRFAPDYVTSGRVMRVDFAPDADAEFALEGDGVSIRRGSARVIDGPVTTPNLRVTPRGTEIVIRVEAGGETVVVAGGSAEIVLVAGGETVTITAGQAVDMRPGGPLSKPRPGSGDLEAWAQSVALAAAAVAKSGAGAPATAGAGSSGGGADWLQHLPWIGVVVVGCLVIAIALARRRRH